MKTKIKKQSIKPHVLGNLWGGITRQCSQHNHWSARISKIIKRGVFDYSARSGGQTGCFQAEVGDEK